MNICFLGQTFFWIAITSLLFLDNFFARRKSLANFWNFLFLGAIEITLHNLSGDAISKESEIMLIIPWRYHFILKSYNPGKSVVQLILDFCISCLAVFLSLGKEIWNKFLHLLRYQHLEHVIVDEIESVDDEINDLSGHTSDGLGVNTVGKVIGQAQQVYQTYKQLNIIAKGIINDSDRSTKVVAKRRSNVRR